MAILCLVLAPSIETPAQTAPWDIETVQHRLVDLGYGVGEIDGHLGPRTRAALRAFQADRGLPVTGLPDGTTQRALFAAEPPDAAAEAATPNDDPPDLDAVPLGPVQVEPLAPFAKGTPHEGDSVERNLAERPGETVPPVSADQGSALFQGDSFAESESWDRWIKWAAAGLAALGALVLLAAVGHKSTKRKTAVAEQPRPVAAAPPSAMTPSTMTILRNGHVFGVEVPPLRDSGPG